MSLDKLKIPKLNDSSKKFILMKQTKSMIDLFVEKTKKTRNKKGRKVSGEMVETRSQKVSEDKRTNLEKKIIRALLRIKINRNEELKDTEPGD